MKRIISLVLVIVMCLSLAACSGNKKAFEASKVAYENINTAYLMTEMMGSDIYEAWRIAIYERDELMDGGAEYLATKLYISEEVIKNGIIYWARVENGDYEWEDITEEELATFHKNINSAFFTSIFKDSDDLFQYIVDFVICAYTASGATEIVESVIEESKGQMKELSEKYYDYEHYPNLKGYYTTTRSFFDFCVNPDGSFEQLKDTINRYRNEARDYKNDLDFIFEE